MRTQRHRHRHRHRRRQDRHRHTHTRHDLSQGARNKCRQPSETPRQLGTHAFWGFHFRGDVLLQAGRQSEVPRCLGVSAAGCLPAQNRARRACARAIPFAPTSRGSHVLAGHTDQPPQHSSQRQPCGSVRAKRLAHLTQSNRSRARSVHLRTARPHRCKIRSTAAACNHGRQRLQDATLRMLFRVLSACKAPPRAPRRGGGRARRQPAYGRDITAPDLRRTSAVSAERTASQLAAC